jgi:hypothetical protein
LPPLFDFELTNEKVEEAGLPAAVRSGIEVLEVRMIAHETGQAQCLTSRHTIQ